MGSDLFFKHDIYAAQDEKMRELVYKHSAIGYAVFFNSVESLYRVDGKPMKKFMLVDNVAFELRLDRTTVEEIMSTILSLELFSEENNTIFSKRIIEAVCKREEILKHKKENGKKGGLAKAKANAKDLLEQISSKTLAIQESNSPRKQENNITREQDNKKEINKEESNDSLWGKGSDNSEFLNSVVEAFNDTCTSLPKVQKLTEERKKAIKKLQKEGYTLEQFRTVFTNAEASDFLCRRNQREDNTFKADFDWITTAKGKFQKILEGGYANSSTRVYQNQDSYLYNPENVGGMFTI